MKEITEKSSLKVSIVQGQIKSEYKTEKKTILKLLQETGVEQFHAPCGGNGTCRKCLVKIETEQGMQDVLACQTQICDGMCIYLEEEYRMAVAEIGTGVHYEADGVYELAAACDIGTTTVVCHLLDGCSGRRLATVSAPNAQRSFGADVISRIQASAEGQLEQMHDAIIGQINEMLSKLCQMAGTGRNIDFMAIAGNTVMCHIAAGMAPDTIGTAPFTPLSLFGSEMDAADLGLEQTGRAYMAPAVSGYVGGDITAGMLSVGMLSTGMDMSQSKAERCMEALFVDIGTNGEIVLGKNGDYVCCATAAGPAFEGAQITMGMPACTGAISKVWLDDGKIQVSVIGGGEAEGICGSGLVDALAVFLKSGIMDETGCLSEKSDSESLYDSYLGTDDKGACIYLTHKVRITQADIRQMQMAKAAIAAGIQILLGERGITCAQVGSLALAGGFGSFLDIKNAAAIGLIPQALLYVAHAVGNAAGEGAISAALSAQARGELAQIQKNLHYVELSTHPIFFDEYIEQMNFRNCK